MTFVLKPSAPKKEREESWEEPCDGCTEGGVGPTLLRPRVEMLRTA